VSLQVKYFKGTFQDPVNFFQLPMINAVARELSRSYVARATSSSNSSNSSSSSSRSASGLVSSAAAFEWSPRMVRFPHPSLQTINLLGQVLSSFIFASLMFGCVSQVRGGGGVHYDSPHFFMELWLRALGVLVGVEEGQQVGSGQGWTWS